MIRYNLCLLGFGHVNQALVQLLLQHDAALRERHGIDWRLTGVGSRRLGLHADPAGLDPLALIRAGAAAGPPLTPVAIGPWLEAAEASVLFEATSLDALTGEPALGYLHAALGRGIHAITANKGPLVHGYRALRDAAAAGGVAFRFESTVMDGAPIFSLFRVLPLVTPHGFRGVLNSTTNLILDEMERGASFADGVREAQRRGLAETDPSADVDGWDSAVKVSALAQVLMDAPLLPTAIPRRGIRELDPGAVRAARAEGRPYKLVCWARRDADGLRAGVGPEQLLPGDTLASVNGTSSAVHFESDLLPGLTVVEHLPTPATTAYGMLADLIDIARQGG